MIKHSLSSYEINLFCDNAIGMLTSIAKEDYDVNTFINKYRHMMLNYSGPYIYPPFGYNHIIVFMGVDIPLCWNIPQLIAANDSVQTIPLSVSYLRSLIVTDFFDEPDGPSYTSGPVYIAELPMCRPNACVIDGNHRVLYAFKCNVNKILTCIYPYDTHMKYLTPFTKFLFQVCLDILAFSMYIEKKISLRELQNMLYLS